MENFLYEQIYTKIVKEIQTGHLKADSKLPSIRKFADENGLSCNTVQNAYNQLLAEGYIYSKEKSGYYVSEFEDNSDDFSSTLKTFTAPQKKVDSSLISEKINTKNENSASTYINLSANLIDQSLFPYSTLCKLYRRVLSEQNSDFLRQTGDMCGDVEFRSAICNYLYNHKNINCDPAQIVVGSGTAFLLMQIVKLFSINDSQIQIKEIGKKQPIFVMENPCYTKTMQIIEDTGAKIRTVSLDKEGININELKKLIPICASESNEDDNFAENQNCIVHVSPSHQFPTGNTMSAPRKASLLKWCYEEKNRYIIEDDYDSDFRYKGRPIAPLASMDSQNRVIYMGTFSRTLTPSMRISYMVLPTKIAEIYKNAYSYWTCSVSRIEQQVLSIFLNEGYFERHINRAKKICRGRRDFILELFRSKFPNAQIQGADAGLHFIINAKSLGYKDEQELIEKAAQKGVKLEGTGTGWIIVGYAHLNNEEMKKAVEGL